MISGHFCEGEAGVRADITCYEGVPDLKSLFEEVKAGRIEALDLDCDYAFAFSDGGVVVLVRDVLGVRPLWYTVHDYCIYFSSLRGELRRRLPVSAEVKALNPRELLLFNFREREMRTVRRRFFEALSPPSDFEVAKERLRELLFDAVAKRLEQGRRVGVLFSGGVDSTLLAMICKHLGADFVCYAAGVSWSGTEAEDLRWARASAELHGFELEEAVVRFDEVEPLVKEVLKILEEPDVVKVGVALPLLAACRLAARDVSVVFSGLGSEELFAGYERHRAAGLERLNEACLEGLLSMHERDLYRDYVVAAAQGLELRLPFLDRRLVTFALGLPAAWKLHCDIDSSGVVSKYILRLVAASVGVNEAVALRRKRAAQYGSGFDKALKKLAKQHGFKRKSDYLMALSRQL